MKNKVESHKQNKTVEEIAKEILYSPVTNNQSEESIRKGADLIKNYHLESPNVQEGKPEQAAQESFHIKYDLGSCDKDGNIKFAYLHGFTDGSQWKAGQSQHSYTEADLTEASEKGFKEGYEWVSKHSYSEAEVLSIIEQVKQKCANRCPEHWPAVSREEILSINTDDLLKEVKK